MDKNTVWAISLSTVVLVGFMWFQSTFMPKPDKIAASSTVETVKTEKDSATTLLDSSSVIQISDENKTKENDVISEETYTITTDKVKVVFTNKGGDIIDYQLLDHRDGENGVQMADNINAQNRAFALSFGEHSNAIINEIFNVKKIEDPDPSVEGDTAIGFYKNFTLKNSDGSTSSFILVKQYTFHKDDYLVKLDIRIENTDEFNGLNFNKTAYTLRGSPQIGPYWDKKADRYENRTFLSYTDEKQKKKTLGEGKTELYEKPFEWTGIAGKYFVELLIPVDASSILHGTYSRAFEINDYANAQVKITRKPVGKNNEVHDVYYLYVGPRTESVLKSYNTATENSWGLSSLHLDSAMRSSGFLSWLEVILKWVMQMFYMLIPNWGVSIVLLTIVFRILMFPLTKKQSEGTVKMQELQPQMKELQDKYKDNPKKLNEEMAKFYKQTGYNPMSGCLPLLIQFPIIIAMFNLFNNYFEFRGALFIPGWIPDLSLPDSVLTFGFSIPFIGNQLHLLPILYVATQIISMKFTQAQNTSAAGGSSMKMMMYGMPIFFFFIFYNAPSGLLIYWILSNVLMTGQQVVINSVVHKREKKEGKTVIKKVEPPKKKKKK